MLFRSQKVTRCQDVHNIAFRKVWEDTDEGVGMHNYLLHIFEKLAAPTAPQVFEEHQDGICLVGGLSPGGNLDELLDETSRDGSRVPTKN